jgi:hypothetical protein
MRSAFLVGLALVLVLATGMACGASRDDETPRPDDLDGGDALPSDGGLKEATTDAGTDASMCSAAGWCVTGLPDRDVKVKDIWPLEDRAFAVVESGALGVKVLEWDEGSSTWSYIDDNTQNESGYGKYVGRIWSPGMNDVYYAVAPATIYHGTRSSPGATWVWQRRRLEDRTNYSGPYNDPACLYDSQLGYSCATLGVWGTSKGDLYAWYVNTIYHWKVGDDGKPAWIPEHILGDFDPSEPQVFLSAAGTQSGDVWFSGTRNTSSGACGLLVRKTASGYQRIADGVNDPLERRCGAKEGFLTINGWLTELQPLGVNQVVGLSNSFDVVRVSVVGDGYSVATSAPPVTVAPGPWASMWAASPEQVWLSRSGTVIQGSNVWADGGVYQISTIAQKGAPLLRTFYRIRGTSNTNLWLVGDGYALHKTTP